MFKFLFGFILGLIFFMYFIVEPDLIRYADNNKTVAEVVCVQFPNECKQEYRLQFVK